MKYLCCTSGGSSLYLSFDSPTQTNDARKQWQITDVYSMKAEPGDRVEFALESCSAGTFVEYDVLRKGLGHIL